MQKEREGRERGGTERKREGGKKGKERASMT